MTDTARTKNATGRLAELQRGRRLPRFIYNDDSCTLRTVPPPRTLDSIACALDYLKGTKGDCLCGCVGEQLAYAWPSKVIENIHDMKARVPTDFPGWSDDREIPEAELTKTQAPAGRIRSGFLLKRHEIVEFTVPGCALRDGVNSLAFEMPKFPHERDPYVCVYDLAVDVQFRPGPSTR